MVTWDIQKDKRTKHGEEFKSERMRVRERERERERFGKIHLDSLTL